MNHNITTLRIRSTVYPESTFTFNQHQAYIHLLSSRDLVKFNQYACCLSQEQRQEVLQAIKLQDLTYKLND